MARLVLTDASPLIGLSVVGGLAWLPALFGKLWVPREVADEVLSGWDAPGERAVRKALDDGWLKVIATTPTEPALPDLDEGEAACIRIALAHAGGGLILLDDRAGRALAIELGLKVAGTAAVIGMAKTHGLVPSARAVFDLLHQSDFRISSEVIRAILARVGE